MKKLLVFAFVLAIAVSGAQAAVSSFHTEILPVPCDSSTDPDDYGYSWIDNQDGYGPTYNWIDITSIGQQVTGLADDNTVGTFSFGFDFPYYWYAVNSCYIGSNGFISFSSGTCYSQDFAEFPATSDPDNLIAPLAADYNFGSEYGTNECYFYTNNTDTVIISWIGVAEWYYDGVSPSPDTRHTFQVILAAADSSITFQYGEQVGEYENSGSYDHANSIGIEDLVGSTGISYLYYNDDEDHVPADGMVVRFHPTPDPSFVFEDAGVSGVMNETSGAVFQPINQAMTLRGYIANTGTVDLTNLAINMKVKRSYYTEFNETDTLESLPAGETVIFEFPETYTPTTADEVYSIITKITTTDDFYSNNSDTCEMRIYEPDVANTFAYVDTAESYTFWNGGTGGFGNEFEFPGAAEISAISADIYSSGVPSYWYILDSDAEGNPDESNLLFADTLTLDLNGTHNIAIDPTISITANHKFFVSVIASGDTVGMYYDSSQPYSNRGWEYTGTYAKDRSSGERDNCVYVTATVGDFVGIEDDNEAVPVSFSLDQNYPNPFNATTEILFSTTTKGNVNLDIYNIAGQKIKTLANGEFVAGPHRVIWDGTNESGTVVSSGVYFYKLTADNSSETKKMVLIK